MSQSAVSDGPTRFAVGQQVCIRDLARWGKVGTTAKDAPGWGSERDNYEVIVNERVRVLRGSVQGYAGSPNHYVTWAWGDLSDVYQVIITGVPCCDPDPVRFARGCAALAEMVDTGFKDC